MTEYAVRQHAEPPLLEALTSLPDGRFASLDEVLERIVYVQPPQLPTDSKIPQSESGAPPGNDRYTKR